MLNREPSEKSREAAAQIEVGDGEDSKHEGGGENHCDASAITTSPHHHLWSTRNNVGHSSDTSRTPEKRVGHVGDTPTTLQARDTAPGSTRAERVPTYHAILSAASTRWC